MVKSRSLNGLTVMYDEKSGFIVIDDLKAVVAWVIFDYEIDRCAINIISPLFHSLSLETLKTLVTLLERVWEDVKAYKRQKI